MARAWPEHRASRQVRRALASGRYDEAGATVRRWIEDRPRSAEAHYLRAKVAIALGRLDEFADAIERARTLGHPDDRLDVLRALIDAQFGRSARARPVLARAFAEAAEPDLMVDEALARVYLDAYDFPHAAAVLTRWAKDAPTDPRPPLWRAEANRRRDAEPDVILGDYREALRRDPNQVEARRGMADELLKAHREAEAAVAFDALLAIRPDDPAGHLGAGRAADALGDEPAAIRHLDRALAIDPDGAAAHLERARIDLRRGEPADALAHLDRAVALDPFDPAAHYHRSLALRRLGRVVEADRERSSLARLDRDRIELEDLQARLAESPDDARLQARIGRWMFAHGHDKEGVRWAGKILLDHPGHAETLLMLAEYYERAGDWRLAQSYKAQIGRPRP